MSEIRRVGVVGAGLMGSGIAEVSARAGFDVIVSEVDDAAVKAGRSRVWKSLNEAVRRGKITEAQRDAALARSHFTTSLSDHHDRELVIEAVAENETVKTAVFTELDKVVESAEGVLASNTSSIPIAKLAAATRRPERVVGIHFFNPVPVLNLVEIVPSLLTSESTVERSFWFASDQLGKEVIRAQDRSGFIVNALLVPFLLSAIRMVETEIATAEDVDTGMVAGCAHPMGPLRLADLVGLDTLKAIAESLYEEYKEPLYAPPALLRRMVEAGLFGKKSGRGFYVYA